MQEIDVPNVGFDSAALPDPYVLTYYKNLEDRILWLDTDVDESWLEYCRNIIRWNMDDKGIPVEDRKPIKLFFYSYGGDANINDAFIDVIRLSKTPVWGINIGQACSAGCFIYLACHKRLSFPSASFLIHYGSCGFEGTYEQVMSQAAEYQRTVERRIDYLRQMANFPEEDLEENIDGEWFISAQDALKYGICDAVISSIEEVF